MFNHIDKIISSGKVGFPLESDYSEICGDSSGPGLEDSMRRFSSYLLSTPLKHLTPVSADPVLLQNAWRSFLKRRDGCPEETPGRRIFQNPEPRRRMESKITSDGSVLDLKTGSGNLSIAVKSQPMGETLSTSDADLILFAEPKAKGSESFIPLPLRIGGMAMAGGNQVEFGAILYFGDLTIARESDFGIRIFEGKKYQGSLNLVEALTDEASYAEAWEGYLGHLLEKATSAIDVLDGAVDLGWEELSPDERGILVSKLAALTDAHAAGAAFGIGNRTHPLFTTYSYVFSRSQLAKIGNAMMSVFFLVQALADDTAEGYHFEWARDHLLTLLDPFDHLEKSFQLERNMRPYLEIALPPSLPKVEAKNPVVLRKMIDEIVFNAGGRGGVLSFSWDEKTGQITATDSGSPTQILSPFAKSPEPYISIDSPRARLESLGSSLGLGGKISYLGEDLFNAPRSIAITVPLSDGHKKRISGGHADEGIFSESVEEPDPAGHEDMESEDLKDEGHAHSNNAPDRRRPSSYRKRTPARLPALLQNGGVPKVNY